MLAWTASRPWNPQVLVQGTDSLEPPPSCGPVPSSRALALPGGPGPGWPSHHTPSVVFGLLNGENQGETHRIGVTCAAGR